MFFTLHINEINNDDAAEIAQLKLLRDGFGGFNIGVENGFFQITMPHECTGVDVDRGHGFCLLNDQITTGFEIYSSI